jgi:DNA gyrase subunit A
MAQDNTLSVENIIPININEEMKNAYLDYAMSVIVSRALPDVRDGMKPVHRRVLYAMYEMGNTHNKPYKKSARIVGDVLGKYHPHGDTAVYDALVRLAQDFSMRYTLIEGQGNFGSIDGDSAAAMRYTEVRLEKISNHLMESLDEETVNFVPNYDESELEPSVLPTVFPQLLVNGQTGIAVGMATNIPPHNLGEVLDALIYLLDNDGASIDDLAQFVKGPDFPTAGMICGIRGIRDAYHTGRGSVVVRGRADVEEINGRDRIIITELPYQVNKAALIEKIADLVKEEEIVGISDIRDESNKEGIRVVIDLKRGENGEVVLNHLYKRTRLQDTFGVNMVCIVRGVPRLINLAEALEAFRDHRFEVITRRTTFRLNRALERLHILEGLKTAVDNMDAVIKIIRGADSPEAAREQLCSSFELSEVQANAILEMRLSRLTALERDKIIQEYGEIQLKIADLRDILARPERVIEITKQEFIELKAGFADPRRTEITVDASDVDIASLITPADVFVSFTNKGYIKRVNEELFRAQNRGGKGKTGAAVKDDDFVLTTFRAHTHDNLLMFSNSGKAYKFMVYELPEAVATARGKSLAQILTLPDHEKITVMLPLREFPENSFVFMCTAAGVVKRTELASFANIRASGLRAVNLDEGDTLVSVFVTTGDQEVVIVTEGGKAIRFKETAVRCMGRTARGVTGISLAEDDHVVAALAPGQGETLLVVTEKGFGKRSEVDEYRMTSRAAKGVGALKVTDRNGKVASLIAVNGDEDIMLTTNTGRVLRAAVKDIKVIGRMTQGVCLMKISDGEQIVSMCKPNEFDETPTETLEAIVPDDEPQDEV